MKNDATLQNGKIYEMKAFYPIVDAVGYLKDQSEMMFIQVSLSHYQDYELFHRGTKQGGTKQPFTFHLLPKSI